MSKRLTAEQEQAIRERKRWHPDVLDEMIDALLLELDAVRAERNAWKALARHVLHCVKQEIKSIL